MNDHFKDILYELSEAKAEFLVIGAYALAVHGLPRATQDFDIWVDPSPENASKVLLALEKFGAPLFDLTHSDLCTKGMVFQIGIPPNRIDILNSISGIDDFSAAYKRAIRGNFQGVDFHALSYEDLIANKKASGRPKDILDLDWLQKNPSKVS